MKTGSVTLMEPMDLYNIVHNLFPLQPLRCHSNPLQVNDVSLFSAEKLLAATSSLLAGKTPGSDGILTEVLKIITRKFSTLLLNMYNACSVNRHVQ